MTEAAVLIGATCAVAFVLDAFRPFDVSAFVIHALAEPVDTDTFVIFGRRHKVIGWHPHRDSYRIRRCLR